MSFSANRRGAVLRSVAIVRPNINEGITAIQLDPGLDMIEVEKASICSPSIEEAVIFVLDFSLASITPFHCSCAAERCEQCQETQNVA
jgi:hypothetical protein